MSVVLYCLAGHKKKRIYLYYFAIAFLIDFVTFGEYEKFSITAIALGLALFIHLRLKYKAETAFLLIGFATLCIIGIIIASWLVSGLFPLPYRDFVIGAEIVLASALLRRPIRRLYTKLFEMGLRPKIGLTVIYSAVIFYTLVIPSLQHADYALIYIFFALFTAIIVFVGIQFLQASWEKQRHEDETKQAVSWMRENKKTIEDVICFKHYWISLYQGILYYLEHQNYDGLSHYVTQILTPEIQKIQRKALPQNMIRLTNEMLKLLLYCKYQEAVMSGIEINVDIKNDISVINMDSLDLFKVMNIFLDNAVHACETMKDGFIIVEMMNMEKDTHILVVNSFDPSLHKKDGNGLRIAAEIIEKYPNVQWYTKIQENVYNQRLLIGGTS